MLTVNHHALWHHALSNPVTASKDFGIQKTRNIGIIAHIDAGQNKLKLTLSTAKHSLSI